MQRVSGIKELLEKGVDRFIGTQVDALFWSVGEADVFYFRTRTAEMYGENVKRFQSAGGLRFIKGLESVSQGTGGLLSGHGRSLPPDRHPVSS